MHRLEPVALVSGGLGGCGGGWLRVVVGPGLGVGRGGGGGGPAGLGLAGVAADVHPLLGLGEVVDGLVGVPLVLGGGVGGVVGDVARAGDGGRCLLRVTVGERLGGTLVDLGKTGVGDGRVGGGSLLGLLCGSLNGLGSLGLGLLEEKPVRGSGSLDLGICGRSEWIALSDGW